MRRAIGSLLLVVVAVSAARGARAGDEPEPLRIEASVSAPEFIPRTDVTLDADGAARIVQEGWRDKEPDVALEFRLTPVEMRQARDAVLAARFFDEWGRGVVPDDAPAWRVGVRMGDRKRDRRFREQPEFEPLEKYLRRFVNQASLTAQLRRGDGDLGQGFASSIVRPSALVPEVVACGAATDDPAWCARLCVLILTFPSDEDWMTGTRDLLARLSGDRRAAVLSTWVHELRQPERAARRAAFAPIALAEVEATRLRVAALTSTERIAFDALLSMLLADGSPRAFEVAEEMARAESVPGKPFVPAGLLATGPAAVPIVVRFLDAPEPAARECGARMARVAIAVVRGRESLGERLPAETLSALERRFGAEVVPALERRVADAAESYAIRTACHAALDAWDGRVKAAQAAADDAAARGRLKPGPPPPTPPPPRGTLAISGRLLGPSDMPLPRFGVTAVDRGGALRGSVPTAEDGSFRIEGLGEGAYDLVDTRPGGGGWETAPRFVEGVPAGTEGVVLRMPGSMIRGRLLDEADRPAAWVRLVARRRGAPSGEAPARAVADNDGRFWFVRVSPGVYDLDVTGFVTIEGAGGIETGPEERTIRMRWRAPAPDPAADPAAIAGRVVDETGAPIRDVGVTASLPDTAWTAGQSARTDAAGRFVLPRLDPARRYRVYAVLLGGENRSDVCEAVPAGVANLVLHIDGSPRLRFRIDYGLRAASQDQPAVRIERVGGGPPTTREFRTNPLDWPAALPGTWKVTTVVRDVDVRGVRVFPWIEVGTVTTGEPERTFAVPR